MELLANHFAAIMFYLLAAAAVAGSVGVVALRHPVHAALSLLATFLVVAALFLLRHAAFLAAVQALVCAGGVMVLFLLVIMLVGVKKQRAEGAFLVHLAPLAVLAGVLVGALLALGLLLGVLAGGELDPSALRMVEGQELGNTAAVAWLLYRSYLIPLEIVSVVLLVAMVAAIVFGRGDAALEGKAGRMDQ